MTTLYLIARAESLNSCLEIAMEEDAILLIGQATSADLTNTERELHVLAENGEPRAPASDRITVIDYAGFVDLVIRHQPIVNWR